MKIDSDVGLYQFFSMMDPASVNVFLHFLFIVVVVVRRVESVLVDCANARRQGHEIRHHFLVLLEGGQLIFLDDSGHLSGGKFGLHRRRLLLFFLRLQCGRQPAPFDVGLNKIDPLK